MPFVINGESRHADETQGRPSTSTEDAVTQLGPISEDESLSTATTMSYRIPYSQTRVGDRLNMTAFISAWAVVAAQMISSDEIACDVLGFDRTRGEETLYRRSLQVGIDHNEEVSAYVERMSRLLSEPSSLVTDVHTQYWTTCFVIHEASFVGDVPREDSDHGQEGSGHAYTFKFDICPSTENMSLLVTYYDKIISGTVVRQLLERIEHVVGQLDSASDMKLKDISMLSPDDLNTLWAWNGTVPEPYLKSVSSMIEDQTMARSLAPAIHAWDGDVTYGELDLYATLLASDLLSQGISPGDLVPICIEKSLWTYVAAFAVMKAGAAFVLLDASLPVQRLRSIVEQLAPKLIISSSKHGSLASQLLEQTLIIRADYFTKRTSEGVKLNRPDPSSLAYVVFTSGSTGIPKGVMISHENFATGLHYQTEPMGLGPHTRLYEFSSYSFDISIFVTFATLASGGCLCVPSDEDRQNRLAESISSLGVNTLYLTPTVARYLSPDLVPQVETLLLIGEAVEAKDIAPWMEKLRVVATYGPAECTPVSTINLNSSIPELASRIGVGYGSVTWVVDPENHDILVPPGCIGELLLEGPIVGKGYLGDLEKTEASFITDPKWMIQGSAKKPGRHARLYKTSDLVRYHEDGSLSFVGRKDTQVKIRGQRVELGEIEMRIQESMDIAAQVIVEIITPSNETSSPMVAAFLHIQNELPGEPGKELEMVIVKDDIKDRLTLHLPKYMIPSVFFSIAKIPTTAAGKLNRKFLRELGGTFPVEQLASHSIAQNGPQRRPKSKSEKAMQEIWAHLLRIEQASISLDDNFFQLGGDSIAAMKLVTEARKIGLSITVAEIFNHPTLEDISLQVQAEFVLATSIPPFSLLPSQTTAERVLDNIASQYGLDRANIQDVYPCTPLQEGLLSLSSKAPGDYIMQGILKLAPDSDLKSFKNAWEIVVSSTPILRTTILQLKDVGLLQAVVGGETVWAEDLDLESYLASDKLRGMDLGESLSRYALVQTSESYCFIWTLHHAIFDEWSMSLVLEQLEQVYRGEQMHQSPPFPSFIRHIKKQDEEESNNFWKTFLRDCESTPFPSVPPSEQPVADMVIERQFTSARQNTTNITTSTYIRGAWALVAASASNSDDVVFGATVSGRSASVPGIESMIAPTIATVPVRIRLDEDQTVSSYLAKIQSQAAEMIPYEQVGLSKIAKMSADTRQACSFQTLVVLQPSSNDAHDSVLGTWELGNQQQSFNTYGLILEVYLEEMIARATFDPRVIKPWLIERLLQRLDYLITGLKKADSNQSLALINTPTPEDLTQLWKWNSVVPSRVEKSIHELFEERVREHPDAPAVGAWDGDLTYAELDRITSMLAEHLIQEGVTPGKLVPLYFEKSKWTTVAVLAVLKAGGAFVLLDPTLPEQRLRDIVNLVQGTVILCSKTTYEISTRIAEKVLLIHEGLFTGNDPLSCNGSLERHIDSSSVAYVIFTSGSTGVPKGVVINHQNITSAVPEHIREFGYTRHSRIYDFASYSFGAAINNLMAALLSGACLCVPSDNERRSNLAGSITSLRATHVLLTPSIADSLPPEDVPTLQTIILGGEAVRPKDTNRWWGNVKVVTAYGSSEGTTVATINAHATIPEEVPRIGRGAGGATWVVNQDDHSQLQPLGSIGELLLEGPFVGVGYLNDPQKTSQVFIEDPAWLVDGGRRGRLYKTGDLVRYNEDGTLSYIGRKDAQVKIRGQRVELGEVEHYSQQLMPNAKLVVAEVITPQSHKSKPTLALFTLAPTGVAKGNERDESTILRTLPIRPEIEESLNDRLPSYMVPTVHFEISSFPMTATGKLNRRRLREMGSQVSGQKLAELRTTVQQTKRQPSSEIEAKLQTIWSSVLNIGSETIGIDDSFFRLGGDSITAMQVVATARSSSVRLRVADILREKTIYNIARLIGSDAKGSLIVSQADQMSAIAHKPPRLSPIQRLYFDFQADPTKCFDQFFYLKLNERVSKNAVASALETLTVRHPALRARFRQKETGTWEPYTTDDILASLSLDHVQPPTDVSKHIADCRERLDIVKGPIISAALLDESESQRLFITVHHIVVDLVSWRILMAELEDLLSGRTLLAAPLLDFPTWTVLQDHHATQSMTKMQPEIWSSQPYLSYWGITANSNTRAGVMVKEFAIDEVTSAMILGSCNLAFGTRPLELLLSALVVSFRHVFKDRLPPSVFTEGHGREVWDESMDISSTIGWFTTIFPIRISNDNEYSLKDTIRMIKDYLRGLDANGWSHFTSRFSKEENSRCFVDEFPAEILFNYAGFYQQLEKEGGLFQSLNIPHGCDPPTVQAVKRFALFEIDVRVDRGQIFTAIEFHKDMHRQDEIEVWIKEFENSLYQTAKDLTEFSPEWTLSDFPDVFKTYDDLELFSGTSLREFHLQREEIEDVYLCTPVQEGILLAQAKHPEYYQRWFDLEVTIDQEHGPLDKDRLEQAWRAAVKKHELLRAVLADNIPGSSSWIHIVLKDPQISFSWDPRGEKEGILPYTQYQIQHRVTVYEFDERHARLRIDMNHAITDGFSQDILCRDLQTAYYETLHPGSGYKMFVNYVRSQSYYAGLAFWTDHLTDVQPCYFPASRSIADNQGQLAPVHVPGIDTSALREFCSQWDLTPATVIQTAWSLVLRAFTDNQVPCFGSLYSGRDVTIIGVNETFGPFIGLVPCRATLGAHRSVSDVLKDVQNDYLGSLPFQHFPLGDIQSAVGVGSKGLFNTLLSFQKGSTGNEAPNSIQVKVVDEYDITEYDINVDIIDNTASIDILLNCSRGFLNSRDATRLAESFSAAISSVIAQPSHEIGKLSVLGNSDVETIWNWNHSVPESTGRCILEVFRDRLLEDKNAPAVHAWDGSLTYNELDHLSTVLAGRLVPLGVGAEIFVPVCFEKSMWTVVAMLGILKAGGAFVLMDSSLPEQRLRVIVDQLHSVIILSSSANMELSSRLAATVVEVSSKTVIPSTADPEYNAFIQPPSNAMFAIFTSGSTGVPKGVIHSHDSMVSRILSQAHYLGFKDRPRVFDFASYAFDASVHNAFVALVTGGCLCIPSDSDRKDSISGAMNALGVSIAELTPSVARLVDPSTVPNLHTLVLSGEAVSVDDAARWWGKVTVVNAYGPAECGIATINHLASSPEKAVSIGKPFGSVAWVVDPENYNILQPIGAVGELLIEGPIVGRGYLNDPKKTAAAFVTNPVWLQKGSPTYSGRSGRLYRTGDLVRYQDDGSLSYLGRKDVQIKVNGQRVELGEIEHALQSQMPDAKHVVAEAVKLQGGDGTTITIAAFIQLKAEVLGEENALATLTITKLPNQVEDALVRHLPSYMVPAVVFTTQKLPLTPTGKIDRRKLRDLGASFTRQQVAEAQVLHRGSRRKPVTQSQISLQEIWSQILGVTFDTIGLDDSFFKLGGASIEAMKLVTLARKAGLQLSVATIFSYPKLYDMAKIVQGDTNLEEEVNIPPFSLIDQHMDLDELAKENELDPRAIQDVYPATPLQEGLFSLSIRRKGDYVMHSILDLNSDVDLAAFRSAWETVVHDLPILRTRMVNHPTGLLQVVLDESIQWHEENNLQEYLIKDRNKSVEAGQPLARYALIADDVGSHFVWSLHHVLYDGWSKPLIIDAVHGAHRGSKRTPSSQFQTFIKYTQEKDEGSMRKYWTDAFSSCETVPFPAVPPSLKQPVADTYKTHSLPLHQQTDSGVTASSLIRAAWALVVREMIGSDDVVFGATVSGRSAPVPGIEEMIAPTFATVPIRITPHGDTKVVQYLQNVQEQATAMIPFEQTGLHRIAQISNEAMRACDFQTLLVVQPPEETGMLESPLGRWDYGDQQQWFNTYGLVLTMQVCTDNVLAKASFDSRMISPWTVQNLLHRLEYTMTQLGSASSDLKVGQLDSVTPQDLSQVWSWNQAVPPKADMCVHEMIEQKALTQPEVEAICACDGTLTYKELNHFATLLAKQLVRQGAKRNMVIPLCFEKSLWTTVAILGVMKSGAAFVLLDPDLPIQRLQSIVDRVEAKLIVTTALNRDLSLKLCPDLIILDQGLISHLQVITDKTELPKSDLRSVIYIVFTSGTTGTPKGAVISHMNSASSVIHQIDRIGCTDKTRMYDFSTYSFDAVILNAFTTLAAGGCLCVPSDYDRKNNLEGSMEALEANTVVLTPSVADLISPARVPHMTRIGLAGEAIRVKDIEPWWETANPFTMYGPSECTPVCVINSYPSSPAKAIRLGTGAGMLTWVVRSDDRNSLAPLGCVGELLLEGNLVGQGYLKEPEKTAAVYVDDPSWLLRGGPGAPGRGGRLYATGDLVQYNEDGSLTFVGRKDSQVKIRGQRVELGEVEHQILQVPGISQVTAEVIQPEGEGSDAVLVAFIQDDTAVIPSIKIIPMDVEDQLSEYLPKYMVPSFFVSIRELPLGPTGKMDRKALRQLGASFSTEQIASAHMVGHGQGRQPTSESEKEMQSLWAKVLAIEKERIGLDDSFFKLGGNSITAMKLASEARRCGVQVSVADVFQHPRLHQLAKRAVVTSASMKAPSSIKRVAQDIDTEQSFAQGRLWFMEQLHPGLKWYVIPSIMRLRGPLDIKALDTAILALEARHEPLRTTFSTKAGINLQHVQPVRTKALEAVESVPENRENIIDMMQQQVMEPFNLETEPGWRVSVHRLGHNDHILSISCHHIVSDGWSMDILRKELSSFYSTSIRGEDPLQSIPELPVQYKDFSVWEKQEAQVVEYDRQLDYWADKLQTSQPAELFVDKPRPESLSGDASVHSFHIGGQLYADLDTFCKTHDVTPFIVLLSAFRAAHYRLTGEGDATIGSPNANRSNRWEVKDMIGIFVNLQCLRIGIEDSTTFEDLVKQVHATTIASFENQDVPFERVVSRLKSGSRDLSRHPLVQIAFAVHSQLSLGQFQLENLETEQLEYAITSRFDLELHFFQEQMGFRGELVFSNDLYRPETIDNLRSVFESVLRQSLAESSTPLAVLPLMSDTSYSTLDSLSLLEEENTDYPRDSSIVDVFRIQCEAVPEKFAVKGSSQHLTYSELDDLSNVVCTWLLQRSLPAESLIGVYSPRSCQTIIAFLGILKANMAYLPFDTKIPPTRMKTILSTVEGKRLVFLGPGMATPKIDLDDVEFVVIDQILAEARNVKAAGDESFKSPATSPSSSSLAYVMYTSGSTGLPKGINAEHRGILRLVKDSDVMHHCGTGKTIAHISNIAFDSSTWEIYGALLNGGTVVCIDEMTVLDQGSVTKVFNDEKIDSLFITPALLKQYLAECPGALKSLSSIYVGGERLDPLDLFKSRELMTKGSIISVYGPTENTIFSTSYLLPQDDPCLNGVAIGRAISNSGVYVMDSQQRLVPFGVVGELVVTGDGLARGYTDAEKDVGRFIMVDIKGRQVRGYRSGDYVRYRPTDGQLEFLGRIDGQVKIRGQRVELGEIEQILRSHSDVDNAVAVVQTPISGSQQLVCFLTLHQQGYKSKNVLNQTTHNADAEELEATIRERLYEHLSARVPSYMAPQIISFVDELPVNENGKINRKVLTEQIQTQTTEGRRAARQPTTESHRQMQKIWATVLNIQTYEIGLDDGFFKIGGDSLAAMKLSSEARKQGFTLAVADVFRYKTLETMSEAATTIKETDSSAIPRIRTSGPVEQSFAQGRLWFLEQLYPGLTWYLSPSAMRITGPFNLTAFNVAIATLESRHEVLRTVFSDDDGNSIQTVRPFRPRQLQLIHVADENALKVALEKDQTTPFNLSNEPGWRVSVYQLREDEFVLSICCHHIISDGWSLDILQKELGIFYAAFLQGIDPLSMVDNLPIQYKDYAVWQKQETQVVEHERQLDYWVSQLESSQPAEFICDKPRPRTLSGNAAVEQMQIDGSVYEQLQHFCNTHSVTPFVVLLSAFRVAHFHLTGSSDSVIGTVNANRDRFEVKDLIGFFVNMQGIRIKLDEEVSFQSLVQQVQATMIEAFAHQDVPFEQIVAKLQKKRDLSRHPLAQVSLSLHTQEGLGHFTFDGVATEPIPIPPTTRFDLEIHLFQERGSLQGNAVFSTDLYESETIRAMLSLFQRVLQCGLDKPQEEITSMSLMTDSEFSKLDQMGLIDIKRTDYPRDLSIPEIFRQQVEMYPSKTAVKDSTSQLTYRDLDHQSDAIAHYLRSQNLTPETLVGTFAKRSCQVVIAMMGILKANVAYLPFDTRTPRGRMESILSSIGGRKIILVADGMQYPTLKDKSVEFVLISKALQHVRPNESLPTSGDSHPSATSLAYIMYTSGSTGKPKGVMIQQRGLIRHVKDNNFMEHLPPTPVVALTSNIAFDSAAWELYSAILNGGTLVCVDAMDLLDHRALCNIFRQNQVQVATFTPAILKQILISGPEIIEILSTLVVAGDRADPQDLAIAQSLVKDNVVNAYGPTENSITSTLYRFRPEEPNTNGVPIGQAISNSGAYVMDRHMRLVPVGVIGELVVTGDGLARGYTNPVRNVDKFIEVQIGQENVRAYRTGDYVRYRPSDGQLEYFGRIDAQIKLRGNRVELGEIEAAMRNHPAVSEAVAVLQNLEGQDPRIAGFLTLKDPAHASRVSESYRVVEAEHLQRWVRRLDESGLDRSENVTQVQSWKDQLARRASIQDRVEQGNPERLVGMTSELMNGTKPRRILEIGTAYGMIPFSMGDSLISYVGLEPCADAVDFVARTAQFLPEYANKVQIMRNTSFDITPIKAYPSPDLVVVNSATQYLPTQQRLSKLLKDLIQLGTVETVVISEVHSYALFRESCVSIALEETAGSQDLKEAVRQKLAELEQTERNLLLDPAFFTALPSQFSTVEHVEILPTGLDTISELNDYCYDVILHIKQHGTPPRAIRNISPNSWIDFVKDALDSTSLLDLLNDSIGDSVAVKNIPNEKTLYQNYVLEELEVGVDQPDWLEVAQSKSRSHSSMSFSEILEIAKHANFQVELSWACQYSQYGGLDVVFHRYRPEESQSRVLFNFPTDHQHRPSHLLSNRPLQQDLNRKIHSEVIRSLEAQLPPFMVPQAISILEKLPMNVNNKIDRQELAKRHDISTMAIGTIRPPITDNEKRLQEIWARVLNIGETSIGLDDGFFHLGGNSISTMKVVAEARKVGLEMTVADVFRHDTLFLLAQSCEAGLPPSVPQEGTPLVDSEKEILLRTNIDALGLSFTSREVTDIWPTTSFQGKALRDSELTRQYANYFYLDLSLGLSVQKLTDSCAKLLERFPILRACFVQLRGHFWQLILQRTDTIINVQDVNESLDEASHEFCRQDIPKLTSTQAPTMFHLLRHQSEGYRLILRLSHAQYDGLSVQIFLQDLLHFYSDTSLPPSVDFSKFLSYAAAIRTSSDQYWKGLLQGSSMTPIPHGVSSTEEVSLPLRIDEQVEIQLPQHPEQITTANLVSAAWALVLSELTGEKDVVYGSVVAGRNARLRGVDEIAGPCMNIVPTRANLRKAQTVRGLVSSLRSQHTDMGEADTLGFDDIFKNCTDWPAETAFTSVVQHQNIDEHPEINSRDAMSRVQFFEDPDQVPPSLFVVSYPRGDTLQVKLLANTSILTKELAKTLVKKLCETVEKLTGGFDESLSSFTR